MCASVCVCSCNMASFQCVYINIGNLPIFYILTGKTTPQTDAFKSHGGRNRRRRKKGTFSVTYLKALWVLSYDGSGGDAGQPQGEGSRERGAIREHIVKLVQVSQLPLLKARDLFYNSSRKKRHLIKQISAIETIFKVLTQKKAPHWTNIY